MLIQEPDQLNLSIEGNTATVQLEIPPEGMEIRILVLRALFEEKGITHLKISIFRIRIGMTIDAEQGCNSGAVVLWPSVAEKGGTLWASGQPEGIVLTSDPNSIESIILKTDGQIAKYTATFVRDPSHSPGHRNLKTSLHPPADPSQRTVFTRGPALKARGIK